MVPKSRNVAFRDEGLGLPIYLLVGFVALLLIVASNTALTAQPPYLCGSQPNSHLPSSFPSPSKYLPLSLWTFTLPYSLCVCQPKRTPLPFVLSPLLKSPISGGPNYYFFISPHAIPFLSIIPRKNDSFWEFSWNLSQMPNSVQQGTFQRH